MELTSLNRLFQIARFKNNLKADGDGVHPEISPADSFGRPEDDFHALALFITEVRMADDDDYGDFVRRVNVYLIRLKEALRIRTPELIHQIDEIQLSLQLHPDGALPATRAWLLRQALELHDLIIHSNALRRQGRSRAPHSFTGR